jgi:hypothetical protein
VDEQGMFSPMWTDRVIAGSPRVEELGIAGPKVNRV